MASAKFQESQGKIEKSVNNIKSSEEYSEFIERNKTSPPKPIIFKFDVGLLDNSGCKLKPNEISVDEYTVDVLRHGVLNSWGTSWFFARREFLFLSSVSYPYHLAGSVSGNVDLDPGQSSSYSGQSSSF